MSELMATVTRIRSEIQRGDYEEYYAQVLTEACDECEVFVIRSMA